MKARLTILDKDRRHYVTRSPYGVIVPFSDRTLALRAINARLWADNRSRFAKLFGPRSFSFRGEFNYHVWHAEFENEEFWIFTAKTKGTFLESSTVDFEKSRRFIIHLLSILESS